MLDRKHLFGCAAALLGAIFGFLHTSRAQTVAVSPDGPNMAAAPATYIGLTTTRTYTPMPTTTQVGATTKTTTYPAEGVVAITDQVRRDYRINAFYTKVLFHKGFPIIGSPRSSDWAFLEAANLLEHMLKESPTYVFDSLVRNRVKLGIISVVEFTMDIPDSNNGGRNPTLDTQAQQDRRSRGLGGGNLATCAEENLLNLRGDPYTSEDITLHEFSHTIASNMSQDFRNRLTQAYNAALASGLINNTIYAGNSWQEYWAEGAQAWFDCARTADRSVNSGIATRQQLKDQDPARAALEKEIYGDGDWRYVKTPMGTAMQADGKTYKRGPDELAHLDGFEAFRGLYPVFSFNNSPRIQENDNLPTLNGRLAAIKGQIGATDQAWAQLSGGIERILRLQDQLAAGTTFGAAAGGRGGARGGGGPAAGGMAVPPMEMLPVTVTNPMSVAAFNLNLAALETTLPAEMLRADVGVKERTLRNERSKIQTQIRLLQTDIQAAVTLHQEAILTSLGILD